MSFGSHIGKAKTGTVLGRPVKCVAIVGGTHGNELTGIALTHTYRKTDVLSKRYPSLRCLTVTGNPDAVRLCQRFCDKDLNRCFTADILATKKSHNVEEKSLLEERRARQLADSFKENEVDLCIDFHNTTSSSNCIIISEWDPFSYHCALFMLEEAHHLNPNIKLFSPAPLPDGDPWLPDLHAHQSPFANVGSSVRANLGIEIGPQSHGTLHEWTYKLADTLLRAALTFCELYNTGQLHPAVDDREIFVLNHAVRFPDVDEEGPDLERLSSAIHPALQGRDFHPLHFGDPAFVLFGGRATKTVTRTRQVNTTVSTANPIISQGTGATIQAAKSKADVEATHAANCGAAIEVYTWQKGDLCYPVFVGEAAYRSKGIAFYACDRHMLRIPPLQCVVVGQQGP